MPSAIVMSIWEVFFLIIPQRPSISLLFLAIACWILAWLALVLLGVIIKRVWLVSVPYLITS